MSGGVVQLVAVGPQDAWLTGKPEVSFYRSNYRRYTHFANSVERQVIQGAPIANGISTIRFEKKGDLLSYVYLTARDNNGAGVVGLDWSKVIDKVELMIGGQIVDTHDFEYMADIEPLVGAQNWSQRYLNLNNSALNNQKASFFPFKFFFCKEWTLCLPLIGLQFHDVEIRITWSSYLNQTITFGVPTNISATQVSQLTTTSATVTLPAGATGTLASSTITATQPGQVFLNGTTPNNLAVAISSASAASTASVSFPYGTTTTAYAGAPPIYTMTTATGTGSGSSAVYPFGGSTLALNTSVTLNPASVLTTAPSIGMAVVGLQGFSGLTGSNVWQGAFCNTATTAAQSIAFCPPLTGPYPTTAPTSNHIYNFNTISGAAPLSAAVNGGSTFSVSPAASTIKTVLIGAAQASNLYPGSAFLYNSGADTVQSRANSKFAGLITSITSNVTTASIAVRFPAQTDTTALTETLTPSSAYPTATGLALLVGAPTTSSIVVTISDLIGTPVVGQFVLGVDMTSGSSTFVGTYLTNINTSVTPTQYTISYFSDKTITAPTTVPGLISFFNTIFPTTTMTTPTLSVTSNYSTVTSVSQTDPNISAGQLITTSPTSVNLINSGLLTTASGKNALSISYPTTSTATAVQPSPSSSTLYTFNPKAIGSTPSVAAGSTTTTSSISFTLTSISSNTVSVGDMVVGINAVPLSSTTTQAAYVSAISGGTYTVTFVPALVSNPSFTGVSVISFFPSSSTSTSTYASVQYQAWSNFIYLDQTERDWFAKEKHDLLITQVQRIVMGTNPVQELALAQPVKFIAFPCVNYSQIYANGTGSVAAANYQLKTQVNGVDVGDSRHLYHWVDVPQYFNTPWGYIHNNQTANVAIISYCLDTSKLQPTGTLNFSRLDNFRLVVPSTLPNGILGLAGPVNYPTQYLYAVNYNIFRIQNGLGSILYAN